MLWVCDQRGYCRTLCGHIVPPLIIKFLNYCFSTSYQVSCLILGVLLLLSFDMIIGVIRDRVLIRVSIKLRTHDIYNQTLKRSFIILLTSLSNRRYFSSFNFSCSSDIFVRPLRDMRSCVAEQLAPLSHKQAFNPCQAFL
jgi:hypothetical protein